MHPGNDTDTVVIVGGPAHVLNTDLGGLYSGQQLQLDGACQLFIQECHHLGAVLCHLPKTFLSVEILRTHHKI